MGVLYLLFESASGYALFERLKSEEIGITLEEVQNSVVDLARFSKIVNLKAFHPFTSAENALENINHISEGEVTQDLINFLESSIGKKKKSAESKISLGVTEPKIGGLIGEALGIKCKSNELILELLRGVRLHFHRFVKQLKASDIAQAQLGLGHAYSRSKVKFNVHRVDNMIIQSISLLDQLDKDLNTFAMRVREWYSWHFPEMVQVVSDNYQFAKLASLIKDKSTLSEASLPAIQEVVGGDADKAKQVLDAARMSMGQDISPIDIINIDQFATRVVKLSEYRTSLHNYLISKMSACAPNLSALIGELVGARLISHAGSLTSLAKYPASTVQILGAEKALFRALKTRGNTPKYGLIFHSSFIGRAAAKNKGRISRYLANKCSIASRIDSFSDGQSTNVFGNKLREQVEERLEFYKTGKAPKKNIDVMRSSITEAGTVEVKETDKAAKKKKKEKKEAEPVVAEEESGKKKKKDKKRKAEAPAAEAEAPAKKDKKRKAEAPAAEEPKKQKKDKKKTKK